MTQVGRMTKRVPFKTPVSMYAQKGQNKLISRPSFKTLATSNGMVHMAIKAYFKTFFQDPCTKALQIESKVSILSIICQPMSTLKVITDPVKSTKVPTKRTVNSGSTTEHPGSTTIYVEPGSTQINCTKDLQTLYPNSFDRIGGMSGEYDIKIDPSSTICTTQETQSTN